MSCSTLTLTPEPTTGSGAGVSADILARAARDDYWRWLHHIANAAGCAHPIQLRGQLHTLDPATGQILASRSTQDMPDQALYTPCGNRRATVCPSCAEIYRADTYQLVLAGLRGGKGVPDTVARHPCVFVTFTAPAFGPVHSRRERGGRVLPCRPRRNCPARGRPGV
jgi:hypothetical protein